MPSYVRGSDNFDSGQVVGQNQTWQDVTASRAKNVVYTNTSGKSIYIEISVSTGAGSGQFFNLFVNSNQVVWSGGTVNSYSNMSAIIPNGATYECRDNVAGATITRWSELR